MNSITGATDKKIGATGHERKDWGHVARGSWNVVREEEIVARGSWNVAREEEELK